MITEQAISRLRDAGLEAIKIGGHEDKWTIFGGTSLDIQHGIYSGNIISADDQFRITITPNGWQAYSMVGQLPRIILGYSPDITEVVDAIINLYSIPKLIGISVEEFLITLSKIQGMGYITQSKANNEIYIYPDIMDQQQFVEVSSKTRNEPSYVIQFVNGKVNLTKLENSNSITSTLSSFHQVLEMIQVKGN